jgi:hypothetical protein
MGRVNRRKVREQYSPQVVTEQIGAVYESLLASQ